MKKFFRRAAIIILLIIGAFSSYALITGRLYLFKAVWYNFANIDDFKIFTNDTVAISTPQPGMKSANRTGPFILRSLMACWKP